LILIFKIFKNFEISKISKNVKIQKCQKFEIFKIDCCCLGGILKSVLFQRGVVFLIVVFPPPPAAVLYIVKHSCSAMVWVCVGVCVVCTFPPTCLGMQEMKITSVSENSRCKAGGIKNLQV
jgi:hypothetical protein